MSWQCGSSGRRRLLFGGCGSSLAQRCWQPQWWGRRHGPRAGDGIHLFMVTCSGLVTVLASTAEGETVWRLLGWEGLLSIVC
jgi:hypothetical protein